MTGVPYDPAAGLALRLNFLFHALRLGLLPDALARQVETVVSQAGAESLSSEVRRLRLLFAESQSDLALDGLAAWADLDDESVSACCRVALSDCPSEATPRQRAESLGRFCEMLTGPNRRGTGAYFTPSWLADDVASTVIHGLLAGRGAFPFAALSHRILDPAIGAGAFAIAAIEAVADAIGEERDGARRAAAQDCIFGIEVSPFAAEACRLAVWLAVSRPGKFATIPADHIPVRQAFSPFPRHRSFDAVVGNPPWGVKLDPDQARALASADPEALSGHRDSYLFFLHLAARAVRDDGALGLVLPDTVLYQVRYEGMRRSLLKRFRPLKIALLGDSIFRGATTSACILTLAGKRIAPRFHPAADLRGVERDRLSSALSHPASLTPRDAPVRAQHAAFLRPAAWLHDLAERLSPELPAIGDPSLGYEFHDTGINYPTAVLGRAILYAGDREHPEDIPVTRGRDFGPFTPIGHSAWLRHDWRQRIGSSFADSTGDPPRRRPHKVAVSDDIYRRAPKLLLRQTADRPIATLDRMGVHFGRSVIAISARAECDLLHLLALLNSRALAALYRALAPEQGRTFAQVKVSKLKPLPVPPVESDEFACLASALLSEEDPTKREELIRELDAAVYRAYGLTQHEIARVEATTESCLTFAARSRRFRRAATS